MTDKIIALDCDGVLLDYNEAFGRIWVDYAGEELVVVNRNSYHCLNYYDTKHLTREQKDAFYKYFNDNGWGMMRELPKAIEATHILREKGYKIVVVTSMPKDKGDIRHKNLLELGFAVDHVIATGSKTCDRNPKLDYIHDLKPDFFVDDLVCNFDGVEGHTHLALIDIQSEDSPNLVYTGTAKAHSTHTSLWDFVQKHI